MVPVGSKHWKNGVRLVDNVVRAKQSDDPGCCTTCARLVDMVVEPHQHTVAGLRERDRFDRFGAQTSHAPTACFALQLQQSDLGFGPV